MEFLVDPNRQLQNPTTTPAPLPNPLQALSFLKTRLESAIHGLHFHAQHAFRSNFPAFNSPPFALVSASSPPRPPPPAVEERLAGIPVYALSNSAGEFVLVSDVGSGKSLGLFCFKEEDAAALLDQMKEMNQGMQQGSKVVALALDKVVQLKVDGVAFRFIPDSKQVANAIKVKKRAGKSDNSFSGVPVFQSRSLFLKSQNRRYRPVFFRKEDLEDSLYRASHEQGRLNPALKGDIQVAVLEDIVDDLKESSGSKWDDAVFIPPGLDLSVDPSQEASVADA